MELIKDLGMRFPRATSNRKKRYGIYKCSCGNEIETLCESVNSGATKSCGCALKGINTKHGLCGTRINRIHKSMKNRCNNKNSESYRFYGGKGVKVCKDWDNVESFNDWAINNGYKDNLTIDRIDSSKDYEPNNCRWITQAENSRLANAKITNKDKLFHFKERIKLDLTQKEYAEKINVSISTINRLEKYVKDNFDVKDYE
jgi:hypothetical protein